MNDLNPRHRFLASTHASKHQEWARSDTGKAACEAVLAEMVMTESDHAKLAGARSFVKMVLDLTEPPPPRPKMGSATLNYDQPKPTK